MTPIEPADIIPHVPAIRGYLRKILRRDEIEDGVQTVLLRALEVRETYRGESSLRVWLLGVARYVGMELARGRRMLDSVDDQTPDPRPSALTVCETIEALGIAHRAMGEDSALVISAVDDDLATVARHAGISHDACRQRVSRARARARMALSQT